MSNVPHNHDMFIIVIIWSKAKQRTYITKISYVNIYTTCKGRKIIYDNYNYCVRFILLKTDCSETSLIWHPLIVGTKFHGLYNKVALLMRSYSMS